MMRDINSCPPGPELCDTQQRRQILNWPVLL